MKTSVRYRWFAVAVLFIFMLLHQSDKLLIKSLTTPISSANVIATVYDITVPEVRSSPLTIQYLIGNGGVAIAPLLAGLITKKLFTSQCKFDNLCICLDNERGSKAMPVYFMPKDINTLRGRMQERAEFERNKSAP